MEQLHHNHHLKHSYHHYRISHFCFLQLLHGHPKITIESASADVEASSAGVVEVERVEIVNLVVDHQ
jgi:hypothetical protein